MFFLCPSAQIPRFFHCFSELDTFFLHLLVYNRS